MPFCWFVIPWLISVAPTWNLPTANNLGVAENTAAGTPVFQVVATDLDGDAITYTETSGNAFFVINNGK